MTRRAGHSAPVEGILAIEYDVALSNRTHMDEKRRVYPVLGLSRVMAYNACKSGRAGGPSAVESARV